MNWIKFSGKILKMEEKAKKFEDIMAALCGQFNGMVVKIPHGKFKRRWGEIENAHYSSGEVVALIRPYRLKGSGDPLLWDHPDAKTFWSLNDVPAIKEE